MIELKKVSYKVKNKTILKNIDLKIDSGKKYLLLGASGSGKTSLLKILNNLISVTSGEVLLNQTNINQVLPNLLRKKISLVMQDSILFGNTVKDNFKYINSLNNFEIQESKFIQYLEKVNLKKDFYEKKIKKLSGGEKQRIALVRTLMNNPEYLIADEPFSALDKTRIFSVMRLLNEIVKKDKIGLIVISHYFIDIMDFFDKIIFIYQGEIIFNDNPENLFKSENKHITDFLEGEDE